METSFFLPSHFSLQLQLATRVSLKRTCLQKCRCHANHATSLLGIIIYGYTSASFSQTIHAGKSMLLCFPVSLNQDGCGASHTCTRVVVIAKASHTCTRVYVFDHVDCRQIQEGTALCGPSVFAGPLNDGDARDLYYQRVCREQSKTRWSERSRAVEPREDCTCFSDTRNKQWNCLYCERHFLPAGCALFSKKQLRAAAAAMRNPLVLRMRENSTQVIDIDNPKPTSLFPKERNGCLEHQ